MTAESLPRPQIRCILQVRNRSIHVCTKSVINKKIKNIKYIKNLTII